MCSAQLLDALSGILLDGLCWMQLVACRNYRKEQFQRARQRQQGHSEWSSPMTNGGLAPRYEEVKRQQGEREPDEIEQELQLNSV